MFNVRVTFNVDPSAYFGKLVDFFQRADDALYEAAQEVYAETTPPTLEALQTYPGPVKLPIAWLSVAQQRAARTRMRKLGNYPYQRTGAYARGWSIALLREAGASRMVLNNSTVDGTGIAYGIYVGGGVSPAAPGLHQQPFHRNTGWQPNAAVVTQWQNEVVARVSANFFVRMKQVAQVTGQQVTYG